MAPLEEKVATGAENFGPLPPEMRPGGQYCLAVRLH